MLGSLRAATPEGLTLFGILEPAASPALDSVWAPLANTSTSSADAQDQLEQYVYASTEPPHYVST